MAFRNACVNVTVLASSQARHEMCALRAWKAARRRWTGMAFASLLLLCAHPAWPAGPVDFRFIDMQGHTLQLSALKGKWVLVNFWAPWCPPCWFEMPALNELHAQESPRMAVIGVAMDYTDRESVVDTVRKSEIRYPIVLGGSAKDGDSAAKQVGPVPFYPTTYLYAPDGRIAMFKPGMIDTDEIRSFIRRHEQKRQGRTSE